MLSNEHQKHTAGWYSHGFPPRTSKETILDDFSESVYGVNDLGATSIWIFLLHLFNEMIRIWIRFASI